MRRLSITTWVVLALCVIVGLAATVITALVVVRLNRQILASAAELRAGLGGAPVSTATADQMREELSRYAAQHAAIEAQWARAVAEFRLRYPNDPLYESVATAQALQAVNAMPRPAEVGPLHERWAQAWSDRDAALALLARAGGAEAERARAAEMARRADDELRRARNELRDLLVARGIDPDAAVKP